MFKKIIVLSFLVSSLALAQNQNEVPSFSDGSKVSCIASSNIGNDGNHYTQKNLDVFYRIDPGQTEAQAYFRKVEKIGHYSFDGSCSLDACELSIRDLRTNSVSIMNATFAKMNSNSAQIEIMNFKENLTLILVCSLK